jgi:hypothetical protein
VSHADEGTQGSVGSAHARREQLEQMGVVEELEPGILFVRHLSGFRTKWLATIGGAFIKVGSEPPAELS